MKKRKLKEVWVEDCHGCYQEGWIVSSKLFKCLVVYCDPELNFYICEKKKKSKLFHRHKEDQI